MKRSTFVSNPKQDPFHHFYNSMMLTWFKLTFNIIGDYRDKWTVVKVHVCQWLVPTTAFTSTKWHSLMQSRRSYLLYFMQTRNWNSADIAYTARDWPRTANNTWGSQGLILTDSRFGRIRPRCHPICQVQVTSWSRGLMVHWNRPLSNRLFMSGDDNKEFRSQTLHRSPIRLHRYY